MPTQIERDRQRGISIVKGKARKNLKEFITHGELRGRQGRRLVTIPVPSISEPHFVHGNKGSGGVAQGEGEVGQPIGSGGNQGDGEGQAGSEPGSDHTRDVEVSFEELAKMLGEELELPILPKKSDRIIRTSDIYRGLKTFGIRSLMVPRRAMQEAIMRSLADVDVEELLSPDFAPENYIELTPPDMRYRAIKREEIREASAAIIFMMDVSGSMTQELKESVRQQAFWMQLWVEHAHPKTEIRYIIHDAVAKEVDEYAFYHTHESGGTKISSAYQLAKAMITPGSGYAHGNVYDPNDWNIYVFQFSDGDNWGEDNATCINIMRDDILPKLSLFGYTQVKSPYGSGDFIKEVKRFLPKFDHVRVAEVNSRDEIYFAIKKILGRGGSHA